MVELKFLARLFLLGAGMLLSLLSAFGEILNRNEAFTNNANAASEEVGIAASHTQVSAPRRALATPEQFGAVGDCRHDDSNALVAMRDYLRAAQDAHSAMTMLTMRFGAEKCYKYIENRWMWGLKNLSVIGNGAKLQNVYPAIGSIRGPYGAYPIITNRDGLSSTGITQAGHRTKPLGPRIDTAKIGSSTVIAKKPSDANPTVFKNGTWALVFSYNQQLEGGWLPNARYFDYVRIVSADPLTGVIVLDRKLEHNHSDTYPTISDPIGEVGATAGIGPARISALGSDDVPFADLLYMENLTFLDNPNAGRLGDRDDYPGDQADFRSHQYLLLSGVYRATLKNVTGGAFVPSGDHTVDVHDSHFWESEVDKQIDAVNFSNTTLDYGLGGCTGANSVRFIGGSIKTHSRKQNPVHCPARKFYMDGVSLSSPNMSASKYHVTFNLNISHPTTATVTNSRFEGGGGASLPIGAIGKESVLIDGSLNRLSESNQIVLAALGSNSAGRYFLRCTEVGGSIGLIKPGVSSEIFGTITSITGDGVNAALGVNIAEAINTGDKIVCHPYPSGGVRLMGNTYTNYGGAPELP